jgi:hypothetical protein
MSEVEQRIAAMNRERAGHLWSAAVRLQREVLELRGEIEGLREVNAELVEAVKDIARYYYCLPQSFVDKANKAIAKAEKLK